MHQQLWKRVLSYLSLDLPFSPGVVPAPALQRRFLARFLSEGLGGVSHLGSHLVVALNCICLSYPNYTKYIALSQAVFEKILNFFVYIILTKLKHLCYTQYKAHK